MNDEPKFWFPVKRYGWGWGPPVRWQGWVVLLAYFALLLGGIGYFAPQRPGLSFFIYTFGITVALVAIVAVKGEKPLRWRWGRTTK